MTDPQFLRCKFEIFGKVQKVFFRKFTEDQAKKLGITGWCENTATGSVQGEIEGVEPQFSHMKLWLSKTGSPKSVIDKAVFSEQFISANRHFEKFGIRR